jgi:uncharacterized protein (TIGR03083 family)
MVKIMHHPAPILVADRFPKLRLSLITLLSCLSEEEWASPTVAPGWTTKDVALHLLGGDLGILSRRRDGVEANNQPIRHYADLVSLVNRLNDEWVTAARRLSPQILCELLSFTGPLVEAYFGSLDPFIIGQPVNWAGPEPAPVWFDIAREFTERWHHQQQIRDAAGRPALYDPYFLAPVLDTFMRAVPYSFRDTTATAGTVIKIQISGDAGGSWFLHRQSPGWKLLRDTDGSPVTTILMTQDSAWRLFTKAIDGEQARSKSTITGDSRLALPLFTTVAVIA